jgi:hypothetical protein
MLVSKEGRFKSGKIMPTFEIVDSVKDPLSSPDQSSNVESSQRSPQEYVIGFERILD